MATYKTLDDYWTKSRGLKELHAKIRSDFETGVIDENNYEELIEDLQDEMEGMRRIERRFSSRFDRNGGQR